MNWLDKLAERIARYFLERARRSPVVSAREFEEYKRDYQRDFGKEFK
jgi:hypothetical protein